MDHLKNYDVLEQLGKGSYGIVRKIRRKVDSKLLVLKQINIKNMSARARNDAMNEVNILNKLENPYVIKYHNSFIENNYLNIIMEYCNGGDLSQYIKCQFHRPIAEHKIWKFFIQLTIGLEYIHSKKILHRDIKTMNVFLTKDENVRIGDLGVAKAMHEKVNFAHTMVGTPYYLSPEMCEEKPYNEKSDIWALGCVLYEMCNQKPPFDATNQGALMLKIIRGKYNPLNSCYSRDLQDIVDKCLCKNYQQRPNSSQLLKLQVVKQKIDQYQIFYDYAPEVVLKKSKEAVQSTNQIKPQVEPQEKQNQIQKQRQKSVNKTDELKNKSLEKIQNKVLSSEDVKKPQKKPYELPLYIEKPQLPPRRANARKSEFTNVNKSEINPIEALKQKNEQFLRENSQRQNKSKDKLNKSKEAIKSSHERYERKKSEQKKSEQKLSDHLAKKVSVHQTPQVPKKELEKVNKSYDQQKQNFRGFYNKESEVKKIEKHNDFFSKKNQENNLLFQQHQQKQQNNKMKNQVEKNQIKEISQKQDFFQKKLEEKFKKDTNKQELIQQKSDKNKNFENQLKQLQNIQQQNKEKLENMNRKSHRNQNQSAIQKFNQDLYEIKREEIEEIINLPDFKRKKTQKSDDELEQENFSSSESDVTDEQKFQKFDQAEKQDQPQEVQTDMDFRKITEENKEFSSQDEIHEEIVMELDEQVDQLEESQNKQSISFQVNESFQENLKQIKKYQDKFQQQKQNTQIKTNQILEEDITDDKIQKQKDENKDDIQDFILNDTNESKKEIQQKYNPDQEKSFIKTNKNQNSEQEIIQGEIKQIQEEKQNDQVQPNQIDKNQIPISPEQKEENQTIQISEDLKNQEPKQEVIVADQQKKNSLIKEKIEPQNLNQEENFEIQQNFEINSTEEPNEENSLYSEDNQIYSSQSSQNQEQETEEEQRQNNLKTQKLRQVELSKLLNVKYKICNDKLGKKVFNEIINALRSQINQDDANNYDIDEFIDNKIQMAKNPQIYYIIMQVLHLEIELEKQNNIV